MKTRHWWLPAALAAAGLFPRVANARVVQDERYGVELTWNAVVRLIRVDLGFTITERDHDAGFVLFTYRDAGRETPGSVEVFPAEVEGGPGTRVVVQLAQMPSYAERYLLGRLQQKLRAEYGDPPPAPARRPAAPTERPPENGTPAQPPDSPSSPGAGQGSDRPARP